jgi:phage terminase large subunit-like protein
MSPSSKEFERLARSGLLNHGGNPVMRWMLSNCVPYYDNNENLKVTKMKESRGVKIDGIIASIIAIGEHLKNPQADVYSKSGIFYV